jgi:hypothetical protein
VRSGWSFGLGSGVVLGRLRRGDDEVTEVERGSGTTVMVSVVIGDKD